MKDFSKVAANLKNNGFEVSQFDTAKQAADYIDSNTDKKTVGFGGSVTLNTLGLYELLSKHNDVYWHWRKHGELSNSEIIKNEQSADIYLSSVNGLSEDGEIVNIDGTCNRVSAIAYGHEKVYLVIGENKLANNLQAAIERARNVAAPLNSKRLGCKTPCAVKCDKCYNCSSSDRICKELTILWKKPTAQAIEVILIHENLGY